MSHECPRRDDDAEAEGSSGRPAATTVAPVGADSTAAGVTPGGGDESSATDLTAPAGPDAASGEASQPDTGPPAPVGAPTASPVAGELEELTLPSLVQAPPVLPPGTMLDPDERLRLGEHLGARGRINRYAATWRQDDGAEIDVELREGPADHAGLQREAQILTSVQYAMLPRAYLACERDDLRFLAVDALHGQTLARALETGLDADRALSLILQLVQVVRRLHQAGWALLGLTPADIVLGQPLRLSQVGHAARIGESPPQAFQVAGYSAPELTHQETVTGKEDVFTLGALLYHALAGHPLDESGADLADLSTIRVPGVPQLLADVLTPVQERIDLEELYHRVLALKNRLAAPSPTLDVASATTVGLNPTRLINEDSCGYVSWSRGGADGAIDAALLCVADGMGGMEAGEIASQTALQVVMQAAGRVVSSISGSASSDLGEDARADPTPALDPIVLVRQAATAVHGAARGRSLGTTITCVVVQDGELTLGHVGDTRAYLLRSGTLTRLTADHSLVAAMVASGVITADEAQGHPDSNKVLRSLGSQRELPDGYVDTLEAGYGQPSLRLEPGDWLLLCSDGVWGSVEDAEILALLTDAVDQHAAARTLIDRALAAGAPDNATAVVARCVMRTVL